MNENNEDFLLNRDLIIETLDGEKRFVNLNGSKALLDIEDLKRLIDILCEPQTPEDYQKLCDAVASIGGNLKVEDLETGKVIAEAH